VALVTGLLISDLSSTSGGSWLPLTADGNFYDICWSCAILTPRDEIVVFVDSWQKGKPEGVVKSPGSTALRRYSSTNREHTKAAKAE